MLNILAVGHHGSQTKNPNTLQGWCDLKYKIIVMFMLEDHDMVVRELNKDKDKE